MIRPLPRAPALLLLDLDGTLADTFPDLAWALARTLEDHALPEPALERARAHVWAGASAMIKAALAGREADIEAVTARFLDLYEANVAARTRLYPGMDEVMVALEHAGCAAGVVTNKRARFTAPLLRGLGLAPRLCCVVSADTTTRPKPHPDPLLHAAARAGVAPQACAYVGDARTDVLAARAAGMPVAVACWGYLDGDDPTTWGADALLARPADLLTWLGLDRPAAPG
jgi:phosphoglycolate phosphatase